MKTLYILRGLPGSGKSTLGESIADVSVAADDYFDNFFDGEFIAANLPEAHRWCRKSIEALMMVDVEKIAVCNTFTRSWEMKEYFDLAEKYGYTVFSIIVENRHGNKSVHNVPEATIEKMRKRFSIKL